MDQRAGGDIDHHHFVSFLDDPVGNGFADLDAGDLPDLVVEAFEVLDVDAGKDVDAGVEEGDHVLPSFGTFGARDVGVGELIDNGKFRLAGDDGGGVHVLESGTAVFKGFAGHELQTFGLRDGFGAGVGFEIADDNVVAGSFQALRFQQHLVGFADAGSVAEKDFEFALVFAWH